MFLKKHGIMDYSLYLVVETISSSEKVKDINTKIDAAGSLRKTIESPKVDTFVSAHFPNMKEYQRDSSMGNSISNSVVTALR